MEDMYSLLKRIQSGLSVKDIPADQLNALAAEVRNRIIQVVSKNGGHLASSLGAVELTIALHRVFDTPTDKIIFDVGHQAYAHKILTDRFDAFDTLRQFGGVNGFPKREESSHDAFNTGHSSTSISAALGMARARDLRGSKESIIALIGDGAMTSGMAFEALDDAGQSKTPLIVVLNDNGMSISKNVGVLTQRLNKMRSSSGYQKFKSHTAQLLDSSAFGRWLGDHMSRLKNRIKYFLLPNVLFESFDFIYLGPIDGHNINQLESTFRKAKELQHPVIIHCVTTKGKGFQPAEQQPDKYHGVGSFDPAYGIRETSTSGLPQNSTVFGNALTEFAQNDSSVIAITAAMPSGTGLTDFAHHFPDRFFDVGIAEQHAVTMAAGMAAYGYRPVVAIYSSFLQRAYDQVLHDVCLQNLPVLFAVDRAGLVGNDGETHQGIYDIAFLSSMPNIAIYSPASQYELKAMLSLALTRPEPAAIRYGRSRLCDFLSGSNAIVEFGKWELMLPLSACVVIATGSMVESALQAAKTCGAGFINAKFIRPMDEELLDSIFFKNPVKAILTVEDGILSGGLGSQIAAYGAASSVRIHNLAVPMHPVRQGTIAEQQRLCGLDADSICNTLKQIMEAL